MMALANNTKRRTVLKNWKEWLVPTPRGAVLAWANLPEWCGGEIGTMAEPGKVVAV